MKQGEKDPFIRQLRVIKKLISTISVTLYLEGSLAGD